METFLTAISPEAFLRAVTDYAWASHDKVYTDLNYEQLKSHIIDSFMYNRIQIVLGHTSPSGDFVLGGLCTWTFDHQQKHIKLLGLIGDKNLVRLMQRRWKTEYPYYSVGFMRRSRTKIYSGKQSPLS